MSPFLKGHQGRTERFLALAQPGYKPLQLQVKIPEQKWLSFTISLRRVQSDKGIKREFFHTPRFPLSQLISSTLPHQVPTLEVINVISANSPRNLKALTSTTPFSHKTTHAGFRNLLGVRGAERIRERQRRFPLKEEILPSAVQPIPGH